MSVSVRFIGSGNAFADGGRSHACIHVSAPGTSLLLDCGGSALPPLKAALDPHGIDAIAVSHLHGDHFGGIPYLVLEQHFRGRTRPLTVAGPRATEERVFAALRALYVDFVEEHPLGFPLRFETLGAVPIAVSNARLTGRPVVHVASADPHGIRVEVAGKIIAYTGDCTWSDAIPELARGADLLICEATSFTTRDPVHLSHREIAEHRAELHCERIVLTHLGAESLAHLGEFAFEHATDGLTVVV